VRPIVLDTDVGTDVDDAFAIALAARSPELDLRAVTTVYGDVRLRARMAHKLLELLGSDDVPVAAGIGQPLTPGKQVYWGGWEGKGFLTKSDDSRPLHDRMAVDLICDVLRASPEPVALVAIGPLTNIAAVLHQRPEVAPHIREIICMAGTIVPGEDEWNVQCDPEAARIVLESGLPVKLGTRFIVNQPRLTRAHRNVLATSEQPAVRALVSMLDLYLAEKRRDSTPMYDPVTLSMAFTDEYIQTEPMAITVRSHGQSLRLEPQPAGRPNMHISVSVRPQEFVDALVSRLLD
jgi:purine nucleosidase